MDQVERLLSGAVSAGCGRRLLRALRRSADLSAGEGVGETVQRDVNPSGVIPRGPDLAGWRTAHGREALQGG